MPGDPVSRFQDLLERARSIEDGEPETMALATVDKRGRPSVRMMHLDGVDALGFLFHTNYESRKGQELACHPQAALCFHWPSLAIQVRVEGRVERTSAEESDAFFACQPHVHQVAAWASRQSAALGERGELLDRLRETEARFLDGPIPRPSHFGGYRLVPERIEFWHRYEHRLHDRRVFTRSADGWTESRLYP